MKRKSAPPDTQDCYKGGLTKVPGHTYLYRRGAVYYFRRAVPDDLRDSLGKREIQASLHTKDFNRAKSLCITKAKEVDREFLRARERLSEDTRTPPVDTLTKEQEEAIQFAYHANMLDEDEQVRLDGFFDPEDGGVPDWNNRTFEEYGDDHSDFEEAARLQLAAGKRDSFWKSEAHEVASWDGIGIKLIAGSKAERQAIRAIQSAAVRASEDIKRRNKGDVIPTPEIALAAPEARQAGRLLSTLKDEWVAEHMRGGVWRDQTRDKFVSSIDTFIELVGDKPITDYTKSDAARFKSWLMDVAPNWRKKNQLKSLPIGQVAEESRRLQLPRLANATINTDLRALTSLFDWSRRNQLDSLKNIFEGMAVRSKGVAEKDQWEPFKVEELNQIFSAPIFTGCFSASNWKTRGTFMMYNSHYYWTPLIGLHTGARPNEILQLHCSDIIHVTGIPCISINANDEGKSLKNKTSKRILPIHPRLVALGFLDYVESQRLKGHVRLFPEATEGGKAKLSSNYSTHFKSFLKSVGIDRPRVSFRSFRHNFADFAAEARVLIQDVEMLQGRALGGEADRYGHGDVRTMSLKVVMDSILFKGVHLDHLKPFATQQRS